MAAPDSDTCWPSTARTAISWASTCPGIRRPGVTQVAATLRERGLIGYRRGKILVTDHSGLLATACPCYRIVHDTLVRAISPDGTAPQLGGGRSLA